MGEYSHWPIRDVLLAYVAKMREQARVIHGQNLMLYAMAGKGRPPELPEILRERNT